ncbi:hypothetical protein BDR03DRAFT_1018499 [Suillus americanus]|nr:hypothetical protein BDR03DRAFT_1018499 [Suillus americanus]
MVQLQLPSGTRRFTFTFESDEPGPVTLEVSIRPSLKQPTLAPLPAPDDSETEPESEPEDNTKVQPVFNPPLSLDVTFKDPRRISESPVEQEMLDYGFLTGEDLDLLTHGTDLPNLGPNFHSPEVLHNAVDHFSAYNTATSSGSRPLTSYKAYHLPPDSEQCALDRQIEKAVEELQCKENQLMQEAEDNLDHLNINVDAHFHDPDEEEDMEMAATNDIDEDDPDPFIPDEGFSATNDRNLLHLQFHLPRVACNALLMIFACILIALAPTIDVPFITLQSSNRVLGVDTTVFTLPVCPTCRDVFPPAISTKSHDTCKNRGVNIFLPGTTQRGNLHTVKTPIIKYPYLPLSKQIKSLLKIPGLEAVLDGWHSKPRTIGKYTDIFDGDTCHTKLKGPDGKLFFSNLPHEQHGPDGELRIGVNLGAYWYIVYPLVDILLLM